MGWIARRRQRRDARAAQAVEAFLAHAMAHNASIITVDRIYQRGRRGAKAEVRVGSSPYPRDAWFWWTSVPPGSLAAVHMGEGWGPHSGRDDVLYIGTQSSNGVVAVLDGSTYARASRHSAASTGFHPLGSLPNPPVGTTSAGQIARRTIALTIALCIALFAVVYHIGHRQLEREDHDLGSAFIAICASSTGTSHAHRLTELGTHPVYVAATSTAQVVADQLREQLATGADPAIWRPTRVSSVQLVTCISPLSDGDTVKTVTCPVAGNPLLPHQFEVRRERYRITVHVARTGQQLNSLDVDGEWFPFDALNQDSTQLCGTDPKLLDAAHRGVILSMASASQIHELTDSFATGPIQ